MQYGFFFDQSRCTGCRACTVACKIWHQLPPGPLKYLRLYEYEKGSFPEVRLYFQFVPCYHCAKPACMIGCPVHAISKEIKYGAVLVNNEKCNGCRICYDDCPYGAIVFEGDNLDAKAQKCDMCIVRLEAGNLPVCVLTCSSRALDFGPLIEMQKRYGKVNDIQDMPDSRITSPSVVFKPHSPKKQLVPYNTKKALELMMRRDPLPPVFNSISDAIEIPRGMVGRNELVIKHKSVEDIMRYTRCDEG